MSLDPRGHSALLTLRIRDPEVRIRPVRDGAAFHLEATAGSLQTLIELGPAALQTLALECLQVSPDSAGLLPGTDLEDAFKRPALAIKAYGPTAIACIASQLGIADMAGFLWYMEDEELTHGFCSHLSPQDEDRLRKELEFYTLFDRQHEDTVRIGREAALMVMQALQHLIDDPGPPGETLYDS